MTQDMNCTKTVARQKEGSRKTLAILFEYAWSKPRVCLEYAKSMARVWLEYVFVRKERTLSPSRANSQSVPYVLKTMLMLLMMFLGVGQMWGQTNITSLSQITASDGNYVITADINASDFNASITSFSGTLTAQAFTSGDRKGEFPVISNLSVPIFTTATDAKISNIMLKSVAISQAGYVGAISCIANGTTRIYNCGILPTTADPASTSRSTVASTDNYCGGLVGFLDGYARVINCFSYANITGGTVKAGIVGYNNYASRSKGAKIDDVAGEIHTMVMNCMFYGDISHGSGADATVYPIYGGSKISNEDNSRLNNYNYFLYEADFSKGKHIPAANYNCALAAEHNYLVRFEFYRHLLNSTREVAAWYATGSTADGKGTKTTNKMLKWVLDKSIAPYPILKVQDFYYSVVNYDPNNTNTVAGAKVSRSSVTERNQGGILTNMGSSGTLSVTISSAKTTGGQTKPEGATITQTEPLSLNIIDKDYNNFNFNYGKIQLPYYNDVGTGNYTHDRVVTGWKITSITSVTGDPYAASHYTGDNYDSPYYNFADRKSSNKDLYTVSGRVFSQGAYFDVPDGVTSITIEPYWACAAYCSDKYYDCYGYSTGNGVSDFGERYKNDNSYSINGDNQKVYNYLNHSTNASAYGRLKTLGMTTSTSVYDYAIVLVGNFHQKNTPVNDNYHFTIMSADLNFDNEPDYSLIFNSGKQEKLSPIRLDFINVPGTAMAHKQTSTTYMGIWGNMKFRGWFETTNTTTIRFSQFEYDSENKTLNEPLILLGGIVDQIVSTNGTEGATTHTKYIHVGGNVCFIFNFNNGCHMDKTSTSTPHRPISVTGGDYKNFYLSGYLQSEAPAYSTDDGGKDAECYISGGRFGEVAGAGYELIDGNVTWQIYDADIESFYGGGINDNKAITGNISTTIRGSHVGTFCGGPKFGNMNATKTVETTANDCTFDTFFGAGFGGTAFSRKNSFNEYQTLTYQWNTNSKIVPRFTGTSGDFRRGKYVSGQGISVNYEYRNFEGSNDKTVGHLFVNYASMSVAQTNNVTSTLKGCTINRNYYGGGSLGSVLGDIESNLENCTVYGNVFGAGYSASVPTVNVFPSGNDGLFKTIPVYNSTTGVFEEGIYPDPVVYTWSNSKGANNDANSLIDETIEGITKHWIHTDVTLSDLGSVNGNVNLTIKGNSVIGTEGDPTTGSVYGGGDESAVTGSTHKITVTLAGKTTVKGSVYGGGNSGLVEGSTEVNILQNAPTSNNNSSSNP